MEVYSTKCELAEPCGIRIFLVRKEKEERELLNVGEGFRLQTYGTIVAKKRKKKKKKEKR